MATTLQKFTAGLIAASLFAGAAQAQEKIGSTVLGSGLGWRNALDTHRIDDPKLKGVSCYVTRRTMNNYPNSSELSMSCAQNGPVSITGVPTQENIFSGNTFNLVRFIDVEKNTIVYMAHSANRGADKNNTIGSDGNPTTATSAVRLRLN